MSGTHFDPSIMLKALATDAEWKQLQDYVIHWAKTAEGSKDRSPTLITLVCEKDGKHSFVHNAIYGNFNTQQEKDTVLKTIADKHAKEKLCPVAVGFVAEAWLAHRSSFGPEQPHVQPKDDPDRKEVIVIMVGRLRNEPIGMETLMGNYPVTRDEKGMMHLGELWGPHAGAVSPLIRRFFSAYFQAVMDRR